MAISESQLETWSHQGAITMSKNTYASIKGNLEAKAASYAQQNFEVFLQGSYGNDTNIRADSDVDIVIMLTSIMRSDLGSLPSEQVEAYHRTFPKATYQFSDFRDGVIAQIRSVYGAQTTGAGKKAIKVTASSNRLGADIVVCYQYRCYHYFYSQTNQLYDQGIIFPTSVGEEVINYPKLHSKNCTTKHQDTNSLLKPMIRIVKNMRSRMIADGIIAEDVAPSYFIEGLFYNVPNNQYSGSLGDTFCNCVNWLLEADRSGFICPNRKHSLFGNSSVHWDNDKCFQFLSALVDFWNGSR